MSIDRDLTSALLRLVRDLADQLRPGNDFAQTLGIDHSLERDYGLDSLSRAELLTRIESELGVSLAPAALSQAETPHDLLRAIRSPAPAPASSPSMPEPTRDDSRIEYPPATLDTLVDVLDWHAERHGERLLVTIESQRGAAAHLTYARLRIDALAVAAGLVERGCGVGDAVAVMLPTGSEFFAAFYGALYAGCVPVPLYPPARLAQLEDHLQRSVGILRNAEARLLLTVPQARPFAQLLRARCETLGAITTTSDLAVPRGQVARPAINADSTAFLQYTSGSTGNPKGVVLSHANLLANVRAMWRASRVSSADTFVSWLPLYHDMGLIGACIGSLVVGYRLVLMSPLEFLAKPSRWLWAIHRHRCNLVGGAELRLRTVCGPCRRRRARRARSRLVATRLQRCGAGEQRYARTLRIALRSLRLQARSHVHGIRPRRRRPRRDLPATRTRAADRLRRPRRS